VVTAHQDGTTKIWDAVSGQLLLTLAGHVSTVVDVASSPDGKQIATAGYDGTIRQWDPSPGREVLTLAAHNDQVYDVRYSPEGTHLATVGMDGYARIWEARNGQLALELAPGSPLTSLAYSPDGRLLAAGGLDGMVYTWNISTGQAHPAGCRSPGHGARSGLQPGWHLAGVRQLGRHGKSLGGQHRARNRNLFRSHA
jgi:WD40 repeat protein